MVSTLSQAIVLALPTNFMSAVLTASFYRFADLPHAAALCEPLLRQCDAAGVKGTIVLAIEGVNGTIAGEPDAVRSVLAWLCGVAPLAGLEHIEALGPLMPFRRMKVRVKREIVTFGVPGLDPLSMAGTHVAARDWNALMAQPGIVVIDVRNAFEVALGSFEGAVDPRTVAFSDLPQWIERERGAGGVLAGKPKVGMFCTGGIRCEKSTAYLRGQGFGEVFHLKGGILQYLQAVPQSDSRWRGECFVFDERVCIKHGPASGKTIL